MLLRTVDAPSDGSCSCNGDPTPTQLDALSVYYRGLRYAPVPVRLRGPPKLGGQPCDVSEIGAGAQIPLSAKCMLCHAVGWVDAVLHDRCQAFHVP